MSLSYALPLFLFGLGMALAGAAETGHLIHGDASVGRCLSTLVTGTGHAQSSHCASASHLFGKRSYQ